jgi:hypothetical protein
MIFRCDCTGHILKIEDMNLKDYPALSFQIYDIYSDKGRKLKTPRLIGDVVIMNNNYPKEYDKLMKFIEDYHRKQLEKKIKPWKKEIKTSLKSGEPELVFKVDDSKPMKWHKNVREDGRIEYQCEHGVGHGNHVHGCDGCCRRKDYPLNKEKK